MDISKFKHKTRIQIRFKDIDKLGHVNNANHLTYFELARVSYLNEALDTSINWEKEGIILARMEVDFKSPILLDDEVWVYTRVSKVGRKSYEMEYLIERIVHNTSVVAAIGKSVQVCFDYSKNSSMEMPDSWKKAVLKFDSDVLVT